MNRRCLRRLVCGLVACLHISCLRVDAQTSREVTYDARAIIRLYAHLRMTTIVVLPENEARISGSSPAPRTSPI